ncbi:glycosyl transferase [Aliidiomarina iranensis]|uniref:Glycosyl transferase n=1 Tax=Aliidiomarina iranensis TaxID=1434071 RepID=A0A432W380_9GAMM|nr:glycosyltransferase family A protein [Aliidiomarina iranensis]RUO23692.1 glycosyl transferase [Aliidiomarina iranensis]
MQAISARVAPQRWYRGIQGQLARLAVSGVLPIRWAYPKPQKEYAGKTGKLHLEIVSHCWQYAHLQAYQLSSLAQYAPKDISVTMTVYYSEEDDKSSELLEFFAQQKVENVQWQWRAMPKEQLFRRGIGRNHAALNSNADWVWFTDCDVVFHEGALDKLAAELQGCREPLVYPHEERVTSLLAEDDPLLQKAAKPQVVSLDGTEFITKTLTKATGPMQITHGDVAREMGYCAAMSVYQTPAESWQKCYEDRAFRWLLKSQGKAITVPGVYRIRHIFKGRYTGSQTNTSVRSAIRQIQTWWRDRKDKA